MTVKELQDVLSLFDPEAEIKVSSDRDGRNIMAINKVNLGPDTEAVVIYPRGRREDRGR